MNEQKINKVEFSFRMLKPGEVFSVDGIDYRDAAFVEMYLDGEPFNELEGLENALIVFDELMKSEAEGGRLLIFTCGCGIADDGGWDGVDVVYVGDKVEWLFDTEVGKVHWIFHANEYRQMLKKMRSQIPELCSGITIEPAAVVFPEDWGN